MPHIRRIRIEEISLDPDIQPRVQMCPDVVAEYAEHLRNGVKLPSVTIFRDDIGVNRLADGFNRVLAHKAAGIEEIDAEILKGGKREAILFSVGANAEHGSQRKPEDRKRAVSMLLNDTEWKAKGQEWIAAQCKVSQQYVSQVSIELYKTCNTEPEYDKRYTRFGGVRPKSVEPKPEPANLSQVNGHTVPDPPDVAKARANGRIPAEAVVTVTEPEVTTTVADVTEDHEESRAIAEDLSDPDWLATLPLDAKLQGVPLKTFRLDALAYRALEAARKTYAHHAARILPKRGGGEYVYRVQCFLGTNHPKDWLMCPTPENGGCAGEGLVQPLNLKCPKCHGRGYWIPR